jgi:hypothetical protein
MGGDYFGGVGIMRLEAEMLTVGVVQRYLSRQVAMRNPGETVLDVRGGRHTASSGELSVARLEKWLCAHAGEESLCGSILRDGQAGPSASC